MFVISELLCFANLTEKQIGLMKQEQEHFS